MIEKKLIAIFLVNIAISKFKVPLLSHKGKLNSQQMLT